MGLLEQERFPTFGVDVGVGTEEWSKGPDLVPSHQHLNVWITKESTNVRYTTCS